VLVDSQGDLETMAPSGFDGVILKLPSGWLQTWLANPASIVGERIGADSKWGRVLAPIVRQFTPELAVAPPLPHGVLVDQLGAMLALIAGEAEQSAKPDLLRRIRDCICQRCSEPQLTAAGVAASLNIPPRMLHRVLAANGMTFASLLLDARISAARQILTSPSFMQLPTAEIARQAGFLSASYFARVVRERTGQTLQEWRHSTH